MNSHSLSRMFSLLLLLLFSSFCHASPLSAEAANAGSASTSASTQGKLATEGSTTYDGVALAGIQAAPQAASVIAAAISQAGWTVTVDSAQAGNPGTYAIDGSTSTFWHTQYTPNLVPLPHTITIDMKTSYLVGSMTYLPRQDGSYNGRIGQHIVQLRCVYISLGFPPPRLLFICTLTLRGLSIAPLAQPGQQ